VTQNLASQSDQTAQAKLAKRIFFSGLRFSSDKSDQSAQAEFRALDF